VRLLAVTVLAFTVLAAAALAARAPTSSERVAIARAVHSSSFTAGVPDSHYTVVAIRISTIAPAYAKAETRPRPAYRMDFDRAFALLKRTRGRWRVIEFGTGEVGCGLRRSVKRELHVPC
jgi:hypothetical protein